MISTHTLREFTSTLTAMPSRCGVAAVHLPVRSSWPFQNAIMLGALVAFLLLEWARPATATEGSAKAPTASMQGSSATSGATASDKAKKASTLYREGSFEQALALFDAALALTNDPIERATLEFNAGSCLFELGRHAEAQSRFMRAAKLDPASSDTANLQAAASAFKQGDSTEARRLLNAMDAKDPNIAAQKARLLAAINARNPSEKRGAFSAQLASAEKAVAQGDATRSLAQVRGLLKYEPVMTDVERADVHQSIATLLMQLGRYDEALRELDVAEKYAPDDAEIHLARARAAEQQGNVALAQTSYERSLTLGIDRDGKAEAEAALEALRPLPRVGWHGFLSLGGGYDTNPRQSGTASVVNAGNRARGGSFYTTAMADFGYTGALGADARWRAFYFGDWLGLTKRSVRDVTLQTHGLGLRFDYAPTPRLTLRGTLASSMSWSGQSPIEPFVFEIMSGLRANYQTIGTGFARLNLEARYLNGASNWEFLSGARLDAELSHGWLWDSLNLRAGIRGRYNDIGTRSTLVAASDFQTCGARCNGATYVIPLAYAGTGPFVTASASPGADIWLIGYASYDYRRYTADSEITGVTESSKRRIDHRTTLEVSVDVPLAFNGHLRVVPSYTFLLSRSNVALDSTDPAHRFDYDNRDFTQHLVELSLEARF